MCEFTRILTTTSPHHCSEGFQMFLTERVYKDSDNIILSDSWQMSTSTSTLKAGFRLWLKALEMIPVTVVVVDLMLFYYTYHLLLGNPIIDGH